MARTMEFELIIECGLDNELFVQWEGFDVEEK